MPPPHKANSGREQDEKETGSVPSNTTDSDSMGDAPDSEASGKPHPGSSRHKKAGWKIKLLLVAGILALMFALLLAGELYCRWFLNINSLGHSGSLFVANAVGDSKGNRKNSVQEAFGVAVHIDNNGFRIDPDYADPHTAKSALLVLGDSVAFGPGVREAHTFVGKLRRHRSDIRIFNSAVVGYSTMDYANVGIHFVPRHPEIRRAYLMFCLNDISITSAQRIDASFRSNGATRG